MTILKRSAVITLFFFPWTYLFCYGVPDNLSGAYGSKRSVSNEFYLETKAFQTSGDDGYDDTTGDSGVGLGGSAPVIIRFESYPPDEAMYVEWQISRDEEFEEIRIRFNERIIEYHFVDPGINYVRCVVTDMDNGEEYYGETYTVIISDSDLKVPNFFSPDGDGINDEWKVSYRSLAKFDCSIFDRQGHLLFHSSDPSKGWDGLVRGKKIGSGVYYYIINATGSDGIRYKKSGDINVINRVR